MPTECSPDFFGFEPVEGRFDRAFAQMSSNRPDAVLTTNDPLHLAHMPTVIDFLLKNRIAGLFQVQRECNRRRANVIWS